MVSDDTAVERVTGIEPAWRAWRGGLQARSWLVSTKSDACRAFRVPQRHMAGAAVRLFAVARSAASPVLPVRDAMGAHAGPEERASVVLPSGTAHRAGHAGRWPTASRLLIWALACCWLICSCANWMDSSGAIELETAGLRQLVGM